MKGLLTTVAILAALLGVVWLITKGKEDKTLELPETEE